MQLISLPSVACIAGSLRFLLVGAIIAKAMGINKRLQEAILTMQLYQIDGETNIGQINGTSKRS
jgi:hypothetical protein